jgi:hypothetical protein
MELDGQRGFGWNRKQMLSREEKNKNKISAISHFAVN